MLSACTRIVISLQINFEAFEKKTSLCATDGKLSKIFFERHVAYPDAVKMENMQCK